jgi:hypothetical protein
MFTGLYVETCAHGFATATWMMAGDREEIQIRTERISTEKSA